MDIELADDEKPVLCVRIRASACNMIQFWKQVPRGRSIRPPAVGKGPRETRLRSRKSPGRVLTATGRSRGVQIRHAGSQSPFVFKVWQFNQSRLSKLVQYNTVA